MDIHELEIDEQVAQFIMEQLRSFKERLEEQYRNALKEAIEARQAEYFKLVENEVARVREQYSSKIAQYLKEHEEYIAELEASNDKFKETLAERANAFLTNAKDELRVIVEEEASVDSAVLESQRILDEIRALVGVQTQQPVSNTESELARLQEDINILKERVESKSKRVRQLEEANEALKVQLYVRELIESVPQGDKAIFEAELEDVRTIDEAKHRFAKAKKIAKQRSRSAQPPVSKGQVVVEEVQEQPEPKANPVVERMQKLAGIK